MQTYVKQPKYLWKLKTFYIYIYTHIYILLINKINKKERSPTIPPKYLSYFITLFSITYHFLLNLLHLFWLSTAILLSKFLVLLISFRKLLKDQDRYFLVLYICSLSKSSMWFWMRKASLSVLWKPETTVCDRNCEKSKQLVK